MQARGHAFGVDARIGFVPRFLGFWSGGRAPSGCGEGVGGEGWPRCGARGRRCGSVGEGEIGSEDSAGAGRLWAVPLRVRAAVLTIAVGTLVARMGPAAVGLACDTPGKRRVQRLVYGGTLVLS